MTPLGSSNSILSHSIVQSLPKSAFMVEMLQKQSVKWEAREINKKDHVSSKTVG